MIVTWTERDEVFVRLIDLAGEVRFEWMELDVAWYLQRRDHERNHATGSFDDPLDEMSDGVTAESSATSTQVTPDRFRRARQHCRPVAGDDAQPMHEKM
jgi:hypothetical protein